MNRRCVVLCAFFCAASLLHSEELEKPKRPKETEALINRARGLAPEFTADLLLRIADSPLIPDKAWKQELIEEAFYAGGRAQYPAPRDGSRMTDSRIGTIALGRDSQMDALSLQTRAVESLLSLNPIRAKERFQEIHLPQFPVLFCEELISVRADPYYKTLLRIFEKSFTPAQREKEADIAFVEDAIRTLHSDVQIGPIVYMVLSSNVPPAVKQRWINAVAAALPNVQGSDRTFDADVWSPLADAPGALQRSGLSAGPFLIASRQYLMDRLTASRCADHVRKDRDKPWVERFNKAVETEISNGATDVRPILLEDIKPGPTSGTYVEPVWWRSGKSKEVLEGLRWLNHGNRNLEGDKRFWTLEERKSEEWSTHYAQFLKLLEEWKPTDAETVEDQYHMKAVTYGALAKLVPPGPMREMHLKSLVEFLGQSYPAIQNHAEWFEHVRELILERHASTEEAGWEFTAASASPNPVIGTYTQVIAATRANK